MPIPIYRYPLDTTGTNLDNLVQGEIHALTSTLQNRVLSPTYGAYFTESLKAFDDNTGRQLVRGVDYQCIELLQEASMRYGKEITLLILITNKDVSANIRINYQVLGGYYQNDASNLINMYEAAANDNRPIDWVNIFNKPLEYPPSLHSHILSDVYGFQAVVNELERLRDAIILNNIPQFEALMDWVYSTVNRATDKDISFCVKKENQNKLVSLGQVILLLNQAGLKISCQQDDNNFISNQQNVNKFGTFGEECCDALEAQNIIKRLNLKIF